MNNTGPTCRRCGYSVLGLPAMVCPECGADLREVGIRVAGEPRSRDLTRLMIVWALLLFVPAVMIYGILRGTVQQVFVVRSEMFEPFWPERQTHPIHSVRITASGAGLQWSLGPWRPREPLQQISIELQLVGRPLATLNIDHKGRCIDGPAPGHPFDKFTASAWIGSAGVDQTAALTRELADDLAADVIAIQAGRSESVGFANLNGRGWSFNFSGWPSSINYIPLPAAALAWSLIYLHLRRRGAGFWQQCMCGRCDCPGSRFTQFTCPQCGQDARQGGLRIIRRHPLSGAAEALAVSAILLAVLWFGVGFALDDRYWEFNIQRSIVYQPDQQDKPLVQSLQWQQIGYHMTVGDDPDFVRGVNQLLAAIQVHGHRPLTIYFAQNGSFRYYSSEGKAIAGGLNSADLTRALTAAGLDPAAPNTSKLANEMAAGTPAMWGAGLYPAFTDLPPPSSGSGGYSGGDVAWLGTAVAPFWLAAWFIAVRQILKRSRRLIPGAADPRPQSNDPAGAVENREPAG